MKLLKISGKDYLKLTAVVVLGITGRLNGASAEFWGQGGPHAGPGGMHHPSKMPVGPGNTAGWEEPSPPAARRNMSNYDDGTALWGTPQQGTFLFSTLICFVIWPCFNFVFCVSFFLQESYCERFGKQIVLFTALLCEN